MSNEELLLENAQLKAIVKSLEEKIVYLLKVIEKQGIKKDSHNSHNSPSQDKLSENPKLS